MNQASPPELNTPADAPAGAAVPLLAEPALRPGEWPHPILAREGWPFIAATTIVSVLAALSGSPWLLAPALIANLFVLQFFRDPARRLPAEGAIVLCPADGRIVAVEPAFDPYGERQALKISVFMNVFNVHSNRLPVDGQIEKVQYFAGRFFNADLDKASLENERNAVVIRQHNGNLVTCVQVAGLIARRILCYVQAGQAVSRATRFGFIRFGSRVDVYLPLSARPRVVIGEKVSATETVLADL
jgi:phosphatidylserine decarboxylase